MEKFVYLFKWIFVVLCDLLFFSILFIMFILVGRVFDMLWLYWVDVVLLVVFIFGRDIFGQGSFGKVFMGLVVTLVNDLCSAFLFIGSRILRNILLLLFVVGYIMEFVVMVYVVDG